MAFHRAKVACCREPLTGQVCLGRVGEGRLGPTAGAEFSRAVYGTGFVPWCLTCALTTFPHKPIMFRGEVRLNVEEKKTRAARERETRGGGDERRDIRRNERGPGGPRGIVGGGMMRDRDGRGPPPRGGMAQKLGSGRGTGQMEGRFTGQRR